MVSIKKYTISENSILAKYADCFVQYTFSSNQEVSFIPEGCFEVLFEVNGEFLNKSKGDVSWKKRPSCFIGGLHTEAYKVVSNSHNGTYIGVQFKPHMISALVVDSLLSFRNKITSLEDVVGNNAARTVDRIRNTLYLSNQFNAIESLLLENLRRPSKKYSLEGMELLTDIYFMSVEDLAGVFNKSCSHIRRLFYDEIGISPKEYMKIKRIRKAMDLIENWNNRSLTDIAYGLGYYDQAHFIKDFKSVTKKTPGEFLIWNNSCDSDMVG